MTLDALEFLRRFVTHVLPAGFTRVRHYGLLANRYRAERLATCRRLLLVTAVPATPAAAEGDPPGVESARVPACVKCGSRRLECVAWRPSPANTS